MARPAEDEDALPQRSGPGRGVYASLSVSHSESVFYGAFVWACRALNRQKTAGSGPGSGEGGRAVLGQRRPAGHDGLHRADRLLRARSHCRFVLTLIHFMPCSLTYSVPLCLKRQCDRTLGLLRGSIPLHGVLDRDANSGGHGGRRPDPRTF